jgi:hypothetical protein
MFSPERHPADGTAERIAIACEVLCDPAGRAEYDANPRQVEDCEIMLAAARVSADNSSQPAVVGDAHQVEKIIDPIIDCKIDFAPPAQPPQSPNDRIGIAARFASAVSVERFRPYRDTSTSDDRALEKYIWNLELCASMYPALHMVEVVTRNRIHRVFSRQYGDDWLDPDLGILKGKEVTHVWGKQQSLFAREKYTPGDLLASLSLRFWCNLIREPAYEAKWQANIRRVFSAAPDTLSLNEVRNTYRQIHHLRNRVAHFEPIHHWNLDKIHNLLYVAAGWIDPIVCGLTEKIDRFPEVWDGGQRQFRSLIS